jgi:L-ascorbate metabolism protein UlaG (beta-lactamase superfamily)
MTEATAVTTRVPVSIQLIGGFTVLLKIGGLRLLTDPAFDAPSRFAAVTGP